MSKLVEFNNMVETSNSEIRDAFGVEKYDDTNF